MEELGVEERLPLGRKLIVTYLHQEVSSKERLSLKELFILVRTMEDGGKEPIIESFCSNFQYFTSGLWNCSGFWFNFWYFNHFGLFCFLRQWFWFWRNRFNFSRLRFGFGFSSNFRFKGK